MRFLVSPFLLLVFLAINQFANATQQYLSPEGGDTFPATEQDNTRQTMLGHRMKRAFTTFSPFLKAWRAILKTTFAVSKKQMYEDIPETTFLKIGSIDDAIDDFYSLGPTRIINSEYGLQGIVDDQVLVLLKPPEGKMEAPVMAIMDSTFSRKDYPSIDRNVNIVGVRIVHYFESKSEAKTLMRNWDTYRFRQ